jgi:hypothetical protein
MPGTGQSRLPPVNTLLDLAIKVATGALGGAMAALFLASKVAHRQELGKARAAAQLELRGLVAEQAAYNEYQHMRTRASGSYSGDPLNVQHQARVACDFIAVAGRLSPRIQGRVRKLLIPIFGELTVTTAERLGLTPFVKGHAVKDTNTWSLALMEAGQVAPGATVSGSLAVFAKDPGDTAAYASIKKDMAALLKSLGGRPRLGGPAGR